MKKLLYLLMSFILVACGSEKAANISSDTSKVTISSAKMSAQSIISQMETGKYREGELLVKFKSGVVKASAQKVHQAAGVSVIKSYAIIPNLDHVRLSKGLSVKDAITQYMSDPNVEYAEPNYIRRVSAIVPNDTFFGNQWALLNKGQYAYGTAGADIRATDAWEVSIGSPAIIVAVLDTGIDYNHSDLTWNVWRNLGETNCLDGIDNDGNGYVDDCIGWDATTCAHFSESGSCTAIKLPGNDPMDDSGHGTHVAGIIGAKGNNGSGIAGVIWMVNMIAVKVLNWDGEGSDADIASGIQYAVVNHAKVINASFGGPGYSNTVYNAISAANNASVLFVASAGNGGDDGVGDNNDMMPVYPASYALPNIISVAATDQDDRRVSFSNYGPTTVDVAAPGVYILSTVPNWWSTYYGYGSIEFFQGTSMAAPHVSGLAGLLSSYYYHFEPSQIRSMVLNYVDKKPTLEGWILTGGRINAYKAMSSLWAPTDFVGTSPSPSQISLTWTERANDAQGYRLERRTEGGTYSLIATLAANSNSYLDGGLTDGTKYYYRARAYNNIGDSPAYLTNETSTVTLLNPPAGLSASALSTSEVRLIWNDNSSTEGGYKIERKALEGTFVEIAQVGPNATTFTDFGLSAATRYWYRVRAFSALAGNSAYSEEVSTKTLSSRHHGGGGGCSVGARQNAPTAVADLAVMLIPLVFIALIRRRK